MVEHNKRKKFHDKDKYYRRTYTLRCDRFVFRPFFFNFSLRVVDSSLSLFRACNIMYYNIQWRRNRD